MLVPLIASCAGEAPQNGPLLFRNGDIKDYSSYASTCREDDGSLIAKKIAKGETVFFLETAGNCSHCLELQPKWTKMMERKKLEVYLVETPTLEDSTSFREANSRIAEACPTFDEFSHVLPCAYLYDKEGSISQIKFTGHSATSDALISYIDEILHTGPFVTFASEESFLGHLRDGGVGYIHHGSTKGVTSLYPESIKKDVAIYEDETREEGFYIDQNGLQKIEKEDALKRLS